MKNYAGYYGQTFDPNVIKDVEEINKKLETEEDAEMREKLYTQRLYRGMELNAGLNQRPWGGYYPY